ncbi:MAG: tagaturonate reductase [Bacteroidota bacterium]
MIPISTTTLPLLNRTSANCPVHFPPKVLQFGGGNFLRAFADRMIDDLNEQTNFNGSVIVVKPTERGAYAALDKQEGLFHVSMNGVRDGQLFSENQLVRCISRVLHSYQEWEEFLKTAEIPSIRFILSNTTEAGIQASETDQLTDHPPKEFPAKLSRWLYHRFQSFDGRKDAACIFLPCELIENNGDALRRCILQYADWWSLGEKFKHWIVEHNIFCNTLVDQIVPGFPQGRKEAVYKQIGFEDALLVDAEPYHLFVIQSPKDIRSELPFSPDNPQVVFTNDLAPYRQIKVRILNGAHTAMVPVGYLSGIESVREAVEDKTVGPFIEQLLSEEILPTLDFPKETLEKYYKDVLDRFRNPFIHHRLISISLNAVAKFKTRVLPSLTAYQVSKQRLPNRIVFSFASLLWFYRGQRNEEPIPLKDHPDTIAFFKELWQKQMNGSLSLEELVATILAKEDFFEQNLNKIDGLAEALTKHLSDFEANGYQKTFLEQFAA